MWFEHVRADEDIDRLVEIGDVGQVDIVLHVAAHQVGTAIGDRRILLDPLAHWIGRREVDQPNRLVWLE